MFFQKVIKGIKGISGSEANEIMEKGILCNWWRNQGQISPEEIKGQLVEANIDLHLNHYEDLLPPEHPYFGLGTTYGDVSPFISTSAGAVQQNHARTTNVLYDPFETALRFATNHYSEDGFLFYAYLLTIGKKAVELEQFSEEVRELHVYTDYLQYHHEGEIMAKIIIPSVQIEKMVYYSGPKVLDDLDKGIFPTGIEYLNSAYQAPDRFSNIKDYLR